MGNCELTISGSDINFLVKAPGGDLKAFFQSPDAKILSPKGVHKKSFASDHRSKYEVIKFICTQRFKHSNFLLVNNQKTVKDLH